MSTTFEATFPIPGHDLAATLDCGQAFRWEARDGGWEGVIFGRWVRLVARGTTLQAITTRDPGDWAWLRDYLALDEDLAAIHATFPLDLPLADAILVCRGLRVLRQEPWECLASFILSSTKQIVQIRQIIRQLSARHGAEVLAPAGCERAYAFPAPEVLAEVSEVELRESKMGFRARYLRAAAEAVASGRLDFARVRREALPVAREELMLLPGVGRKIADCVLLFSLGYTRAFPVDVWVMKALRELYFPRGQPSPARLLAFSEHYFGRYGGYAQQYLFHSIRLRAGRVAGKGADGASSSRDVP